MENPLTSKTEISNIINKRLHSFLEGYRQNIILIGPEFSGKNYILNKNISKLLFDRKEFIHIYADLDFLTIPEITKSLFISLLFSFLKRRGVQPQYNLDFMLLESEKEIPQTSAKIKEYLNTLQSKEKTNIYPLTEALNIFIEESGLKIILILNNFSRLKSIPKKALNDLSKYIMTQKDIMFILSGYKDRDADALISEELNILFGSFETVKLSNFSDREASLYLKENLRENIGGNAERFLLDLTGNNTLYINIILNKLNQKHGESERPPNLTEVISDRLINPESSLYQIFRNKLQRIKNNSKDRILIPPLLLAMAEGYTRKRDLLSLLKIDSKTLSSRLSKLMEINLTAKSGSFFYIPDKLFTFWLSSVFKCGFVFPLFFPEEKMRFVQNKVEQRFEEFESISRKDSFERFMDLIHLFKDDTVRIGNKSINLPHLQRFKVTPAHNKNMKFIIGEAKQYYLIMAFKDSRPDENDILEFSSRCSYFRRRQPKKIFISLEESDLTTKVLAKEKKLFFWKKEELNYILRLYNQQEFV